VTGIQTSGLNLKVRSSRRLEHPDFYAPLIQAGHKDDLRRLLLNFDYLQATLAATDTNALIADYDYLPEDEHLQLVQPAIRLSAHVLVRDSRQLAGQLIGRLFGNIILPSQPRYSDVPSRTTRFT
jgi:hypothetical protein